MPLVWDTRLNWVEATSCLLYFRYTFGTQQLDLFPAIAIFLVLTSHSSNYILGAAVVMLPLCIFHKSPARHSAWDMVSSRVVKIPCPTFPTCPISVTTSKKSISLSLVRDKYQDYEIYLFFLFLEENIYCGYSLEAPCRAISKYPQYIFSDK